MQGIHNTIVQDGSLDYHKKINASMFAENRKKLTDMFTGDHSGSAIILEGGKDFDRYDTDTQFLFCQESNFTYLFGLREPGCYGVIDLSNSEVLFFVPPVSDRMQIFMGKSKLPEFYVNKYQVNAMHSTDDLSTVLKSRGISKLHISHGVNSNSGNSIRAIDFPGIGDFNLEKKSLYPYLCKCRLIKTEKELEVIRFANRISSEAHMQVMRVAKTAKYERELEAEFLHYINKFYGCRHVSYTCICCSGPTAATLHYGHAGAPNDKPISGGEMLLLDMGADYYNYASDITCSFPANGKFTERQKQIYLAVLDAQQRTIACVKPGASFNSLNEVAQRCITEHLVTLGLIVLDGLSIDDLMMVDNRVGRVFLPHSVGHFMGLDVHDVYTNTGLIFKSGMVITVEPGIYFNELLIEQALLDPVKFRHLNKDLLLEFANFGGCRLEDDLIVTDTGCENITTVPRGCDEIEMLMNAVN
jgi:Xaa-Pro dipeptidase